MERAVEPELLDQLSPSDPKAIHSRRDLRLINYWMGNGSHIARQLQRFAIPPTKILEIGSGDGELALRLAKKFAPKWNSKVCLTLLDMEPVVTAETVARIEELGWEVDILKADLRVWTEQPASQQYDLIFANLVMHHFTDSELTKFFRSLSRRSGVFVACDPRRWKISLLSLRLLWLIGCNSVTRHDAKASIRAGFIGKELSRLWPASDFELRESDPGFASHLFVAAKKGVLIRV